MQRQTPATIIKYAYRFQKNNQWSYRFALHPLNPTGHYCIENGLVFNKTLCSYEDYAIKQTVTNGFNVHALIARIPNILRTNLRTRKLPTPTNESPLLIVEIDQQYFDTHAKFENTDYKVTNPNQNFIPPHYFQRTGFFLNTIQIKRISPSPIAPVYSQSVELQIDERSFFGESKRYIIPKEKNNPNPLLDNTGRQSTLTIQSHDTGPEQALGFDVELSNTVPLHSIAKQHYIGRVPEWVSLAKDINRDSYFDLTKITKPESNSKNIANLFSDYADKGSGISALIHFHLFRHKENIQMALEIAQALNSERFTDKTNIEIAEYLSGRYEALKAQYKNGNEFNPNGSFARRINYAIMQLTDGMCQNVAEFRSMQLQERDCQITNSSKG